MWETFKTNKADFSTEQIAAAYNPNKENWQYKLIPAQDHKSPH